MIVNSGTSGALLALDCAPAFNSAAVAADIDLGRTPYDQHCAACHGANLEEAPGWRQSGPDRRYPAPPHDANGHIWRHSDAMLFDYTRRGDQAYLDELGVFFSSGMPAFRDTLRNADRHPDRCASS